jgi:hypothetical protein
MGEGLKRASRAAEASRHRAQATRSCGCVFCDLELRPDLVDGVWIHRGETQPDVRCAIRNKPVSRVDAAVKEALESARIALEPFARWSEVYPNAKPESEAGFASVHDPRCPIRVGDAHNAREALAAVVAVLSASTGSRTRR